MRMQSSKTLAKSGDICDIDGCALAKRTYKHFYERYNSCRNLIRDLNRTWDAENARHSDEIHSTQAKARVDIHQKSVNDGRGLSVSDNFFTT
jgi:predicted nucleic acid binding AN1-type Zn finger protein